MYRAIPSFLESNCGFCRLLYNALGRTRSHAVVFDNTYTVEFKSGRSVAVLECPVSRVSYDSLVLGAICETVVNFRSLMEFLDNSYTVEFKSGRSAAVLRSPISRVSCDSLVLGAICETVVIF